jgi:hypothetical protein
LRHGFSAWFGRASRRSAERARTGSLQTPPRGGVSSPGSGVSGPGDSGGSTTGGKQGERRKSDVSTYDVLRYIRSTFDDEEVLDKVPLEAAGNPGAWHAWRTQRVKAGKIMNVEVGKEKNTWHDGLSEDDESPGSAGVPEGYQRLAGGTSSPMTARRPGEWNWDGVWEVRVKKGVDGSLAEAALFGKDAGDDLIRFLSMEGEEVEAIKENIKRSLEVAEPQRRGIV